MAQLLVASGNKNKVNNREIRARKSYSKRQSQERERFFQRQSDFHDYFTFNKYTKIKSFSELANYCRSFLKVDSKALPHSTFTEEMALVSRSEDKTVLCDLENDLVDVRVLLDFF